MLAGRFAYRAFYSWILVFRRFVPSVRVLSVALTRSARRELRVLGALEALGSLGNRSDCLASWLICELWLGVLRVFQGEGLYAG
jgi:hypothetical protein